MRVGPGRYFSRTLLHDQSVMCYAKYVARTNAAGALVTAATIQVAANQLTFAVNAAAEVVIGTYTGNTGGDDNIVFADANISTIHHLIETINGYGAGMEVPVDITFNRWKAALGDFRPGFAIGADGIVAGAANALLGEAHAGLTVLMDNALCVVPQGYFIGVPNVGTERGAFPTYPDHFESDYTSTTLGVIRRRRSSAARRREEQPTSDVQTLITNIHAAVIMTNNDKRIRVYDVWDNLIWSYYLAALNQPPTNVLSEDQPIEGPMGSPLFVEIDSVSDGGIGTDLPMTVSGFVLSA